MGKCQQENAGYKNVHVIKMFPEENIINLMTEERKGKNMKGDWKEEERKNTKRKMGRGLC